MSFFKSRSTKEKESALAVVVAVMYADGRIEDTEMAALMGIAARLGLSSSTVQRILGDFSSVPFTVAESEFERAQQLVDMIMMMIVDGSIDERELGFFQSIGNKMGFSNLMLENAVSVVVSEIHASQYGVDPKLLATKVLRVVGIKIGKANKVSDGGKIKLEYIFRKSGIGSHRKRIQIAEAEVDEAFLRLDPQKQRALLMDAGKRYLRSGEEIESFRVVGNLGIG